MKNNDTLLIAGAVLAGVFLLPQLMNKEDKESDNGSGGSNAFDFSGLIGNIGGLGSSGGLERVKETIVDNTGINSLLGIITGKDSQISNLTEQNKSMGQQLIDAFNKLKEGAANATGKVEDAANGVKDAVGSQKTLTIGGIDLEFKDSNVDVGKVNITGEGGINVSEENIFWKLFHSPLNVPTEFAFHTLFGGSPQMNLFGQNYSLVDNGLGTGGKASIGATRSWGTVNQGSTYNPMPKSQFININPNSPKVANSQTLTKVTTSSGQTAVVRKNAYYSGGKMIYGGAR